MRERDQRLLTVLLLGGLAGGGGLGCEPKLVPVAPRPTPIQETAVAVTARDLQARVEQLTEELPAGFTVLIEKPFVVIGDEPRALVQQRATRTVKWATTLLKKKYFSKDPHGIVDVWLFKDAESYEKHALEFFGSSPGTPFGYYSPRDRALVMNIGTGGGTLVHEMVHAFMEPNFPECPAWFNEGLGSLYEQCHEKDGEIRGLTNWRLADLQEAIRAGRLPSIESLTATTTHEFYDEDPGTNYAQARYLLYYLQEENLLTDYYHAFVSSHERDPTGFDTLQEKLQVTDMGKFQDKWEQFVLALRFP